MADNVDHIDMNTETMFPLQAPALGAEILVVAPSAEERERFVDEFSALWVDTIAQARELLAIARPSAVICCQPSPEAFAFLAELDAPFRVVMAEYKELHALARMRPAGVKVLARNVALPRLRKLLGLESLSEANTDLLEQTLYSLAGKCRVIVRRPGARGIELVVTPGSAELRDFNYPGWQQTDKDVFGLKTRDNQHRFFTGTWNDSPVYAAWIPWRDQTRITLILKSCDDGQEMTDQAGEDIHSIATGALRHFRLPNVPDGVVYCPEYEWVMTPNYIGPDRRLEDTPLVSRHSLAGKRRHIPHNWPSPLRVIDGMTRESKRYLVLFLLCSTADLILTLFYVGTGVFREANPVLRWAVAHPALFSLTKTALALLGFFLLSRLQLWRRAVVARAALGLYVTLLLYWLWLLLRTQA